MNYVAFDMLLSDGGIKVLSQRERQSRFLVMGKKPSNPGEDMKLTFMIPWTKSKVLLKIGSG